MDSDIYGLRQRILGTWMEKGLAEIVDAQFPKRRRSAVYCPFTGELTESRYGISNRVVDLIEMGIDHEREQQRESGRRKYWFSTSRYNHYPSIYITLGKRSGRSTSLDVIKLAEKLLQQRTLRDDSAYHRSLENYNRLEREPERVSYLSGFNLTEEQAIALRDFGEDLQDAIAQIRHDEFERGRNFLLGLANGSVTIDDINKANGVK
jgi:hypothetical protein